MPNPHKAGVLWGILLKVLAPYIQNPETYILDYSPDKVKIFTALMKHNQALAFWAITFPHNTFPYHFVEPKEHTIHTYFEVIKSLEQSYLLMRSQKLPEDRNVKIVIHFLILHC